MVCPRARSVSRQPSRLSVQDSPRSRQAPRAPLPDLRCYRPVRAVSPRPRRALPPRLRSYGLMRQTTTLRPAPVSLAEQSSQVAASPCWVMALPDVIPADLSLDAWIPPATVYRVHLPASSPVSAAFPKVLVGRLPVTPRSATSERKGVFAVAIIPSWFRPPASLATQVAPTAVARSPSGRPWLLRPGSTWVVTFPRSGYATRLSRATDGEELTSSRSAVLSAAPRTRSFASQAFVWFALFGSVTMIIWRNTSYSNALFRRLDARPLRDSNPHGSLLSESTRNRHIQPQTDMISQPISSMLIRYTNPIIRDAIQVTSRILATRGGLSC